MDNPKVRMMRSEGTARTIPADTSTIGAKENPRRIAVTPAERHRLIADKAYYLAERRGFAPGSELDDWLKAESEIERTLTKRGDRHSVA